MAFIGKMADFFTGAKIELKKVSWPSKEELKDSTIVVLISVFLLALFIGVVDLILSKLVQLIVY